MAKRVLKPVLRSIAIAAVAALAGCGGGANLSGLSLLGSGEPETAAIPETQALAAADAPAETPPLPARRPGKRKSPGATAAAQPRAAQTAPSAETPPEKPRSSSFSLASLGENLSPYPDSPDTVLTGQTPIAAYTQLAQRIRRCWLAPSAPRIPNHGFHAEVSPGEGKEAKIVLYEKAPEGARGTSAFKISITAESDGALISSQNAKLDPSIGSAFKADIARWAKGDDRCNA